MKRWLLASLLVVAAAGAAVPDEAYQYERLLAQESLALWGDGAPVARFAGQIHQESGWRPGARSKYAAGLAQFTPATARWISGLYGDLRANEPLDPAWAIPALIVYDRHLYGRTRGRTDCDRWWFVLRDYNGGAGHRQQEARLAPDPLDRSSVDAQCGKARRASVHCPENLGYPRKILLRWEPMYIQAGWPGEAVCSQ